MCKAKEKAEVVECRLIYCVDQCCLEGKFKIMLRGTVSLLSCLEGRGASVTRYSEESHSSIMSRGIASIISCLEGGLVLYAASRARMTGWGANLLSC
jgi:hypothetical protein